MFANFLRLSVVRLIFPLIFRSSTLLASTWRVSLRMYSLNLTATSLFLQISCPKLGSYSEMLSPYIKIYLRLSICPVCILWFDLFPALFDPLTCSRRNSPQSNSSSPQGLHHLKQLHYMVWGLIRIIDGKIWQCEGLFPSQNLSESKRQEFLAVDLSTLHL